MTTQEVLGVLEFLERRLGSVQPAEAAARASGQGVAIARFAEGLTSEEELRGELQALGYTGDVLDNRVTQALLRRQLDLYRDRVTAWRGQVAAGEITESEFLTLLEIAGTPPETIEIEMRRVRPPRPTAVRQSVQAGLRVLEAQAVAERPVPRSVATTLRLLAAEETVPPGPPPQPVQTTLAVLSAVEIAPAPAPRRAQTTLAILEAQEV